MTFTGTPQIQALKSSINDLLTANESGVNVYSLSILTKKDKVTHVVSKLGAYSFGVPQFDLGQGSTAPYSGVATFNFVYSDILLNAKAEDGSYIFDPTIDHGFVENCPEANKAYNNTIGKHPVTSFDVTKVNSALSSAYGRSHIDSYTDVYYDGMIAKIQNRAGSSQFGKSNLFILETADIMNWIGPNARYEDDAVNNLADKGNGFKNADPLSFGQYLTYFVHDNKPDHVDSYSGPNTAFKRIAAVVDKAGGYTPIDSTDALNALRAYSYLFLKWESNILGSDQYTANLNSFIDKVVSPAQNLIIPMLSEQYGVTSSMVNTAFVYAGFDQWNAAPSVLNAARDDENDVLIGGGGNSEVISGNGKDILCAGTGNSTLVAGSGNDTLISGGGLTTSKGGSGASTYIFNGYFGGATDVIDDPTGKGTVVVRKGDGSKVTAGDGTVTSDGTGTWHDTNGLHYSFEPSPQTAAGLPSVGTLTITGDALNGGKIVINNFNISAAQTNPAGFMGIHLPEQVALDRTGREDPFGGFSVWTVPSPRAIDPYQGDLSLTAYVSAPKDTIQTVLVSMTEGDASAFAVDTGKGLVSLANGPVAITIQAGQSSAAFGLVNTADVAAPETIQLTETLAGSGPGFPVATGTLSIDYFPEPNDPTNVSAVPPTNVVEGKETTLAGGSEYMLYQGTGANDLIDTGPGKNSVLCAAGDDVINAEGTDDSINAAYGNDTINGNAGGQLFVCDAGGSDVVIGHGGSDVLDMYANGRQGDNRIFAGEQTDLATAIANAGTGVATGQQGDFIQVSDGDNTIVGGNGNDYIAVGTGNNVVVCGPGDNIIEQGVEPGSLINGIDGWTANVVTVPGPTADTSTREVQVSALQYRLSSGEGTSDIFGGSGDNEIFVWAGNSVIQAGSGHSEIFAGTGDSTVIGGSGSLSFAADGGDSYIQLSSGANTIWGGWGNTTIIGGSGDDVLIADGRDAYLGASGGDPTQQHNYLMAGSGSATIVGSAGFDTLIGGKGTDVIQAGTGNELIVGGSGRDTLVGDTGGTTGSDTICAGDGATYIDGFQAANATIYGGLGSDTINGSTGVDIIYAGDGGSPDAPTQVFAHGTSDTIYGGAGSDALCAGSGDDVIYAGDGGTASAPTTVLGGSGSSTLFGGAGDAILQGGSGSSVIYAGEGKDTLIGTSGNDTMFGGDGYSTLQGGSGTDVLYAGSGDQVLIATSGNATLYGGAGNDILEGGSASSVLHSGQGDTQMYGGSGTTTFVINSDAGSVEISGFRPGEQVVFDDGISVADVSIDALLVDGTAAGTVDITLSAGGTIELNGISLANAPQFAFAGGGAYDLAGLLNAASSGTQTFAQDGTLEQFASSSVSADGQATIDRYDVSGNFIGYTLATNDGKGNTSARNYSTGGVLLSDASHSADGSSTGDVFGSDGSQSHSIDDGHGNVSTTSFGSSGTPSSDIWAASDGSSGSDAYNADGSYTRNTNDGHGNLTSTVYSASGAKISDTWVSANGTSGSDTFNADGSSSGQKSYPDGSVSAYTDDGHGDRTETITLAGQKIGDVWSKSDGTHGRDYFAGDGTSSGVVYNADGSFSTYFNYGFGDVSVEHFDAQGHLVDPADSSGANTTQTNNSNGTSSIRVDDGAGNVKVQYFNASGVLVGDTWRKSDGSHGDDHFNADGSSSGTGYEATGASQTYVNDGNGKVITKSYAFNGQLTGSSVSETQGLGNVITTLMDASGNRVSEAWQHGDGTSGIDLLPLANDFGATNIVAGEDALYQGAGPDASVSWQAADGSNFYGASYSSDQSFDGSWQLMWTNANQWSYERTFGYLNDPHNGFDRDFQGPDGEQIDLGAVTADAQVTSAFASGSIVGYLDIHSEMSNDFREEIGTDGIKRLGFSDPATGLYSAMVTGSADTALTLTSTNADGSYATLRDDGLGNVVLDDYDAQGHKREDVWFHNDGSFGMDHFHADGSRDGLSGAANEAAVTYVDDGQGHVSTSAYPGAALVAVGTTYSGASAIQLRASPSDWTHPTPTGTGSWSDYLVSVPDGHGGTLGISARAGGSASVVDVNNGAWSNVTSSVGVFTDPGYQADVTVSGLKTSWNFSASGGVLSRSVDNGSGQVMTYTYDATGRPDGFTVATTDAQGIVTTQKFDASGASIGSSVASTASDGTVTTRNYDVHGVLTGWTIVATDSQGDTLTSNYDANGVLKSGSTMYLTGANEATITSYDASGTATGAVVTTTDDAGVIRTSTYGAGGALIDSVVATPDASGSYATATYDATGALTGYVTATTAIPQGTCLTSFNAQGRKLGDSTLAIDGSLTTDVYATDGSTITMVCHADGTATQTVRAANGDVTTTEYGSTGSALRDSRVLADGGQATDTFNADGSASGTTSYRDGTSTRYVKTAQGQETFTHYAADGTTIIGTTVESTSSGTTTVANYAADGARLNDSWWNTDGSSGTDTFQSDGSGSGTGSYTDGSTAVVTSDGRGNSLTTRTDASGFVSGDAWTHADGSSGTDSFNADGSSFGRTLYADGQSSVYSDDGHGNRVTDRYSATGALLSVAATGSNALVLSGGSGPQALYANDGNDTLVAGSAQTTLVGGSGNDTFVINSNSDVITAQASGSNTVQTFVSYVAGANVNRIVGVGNADIFLTSNGDTRLISANSGNDTLVAGAGVSTLVGGTGSDTFVINNVSDVVKAQLGGVNTVQSSVSYTAGANVAKVVGTGAANLQLVGNDLSNVIVANSGDDVLVAGHGVATLVGGAGNDTFVINNQADVVQAQAGGVNSVQTSVSYVAGDHVTRVTGVGKADLTLTGNGLANAIMANGGNDTLVAGSGIATLIGGTGNDTFVLNNAADVVIALRGGANSVDTSVSFVAPDNVSNIIGTGTADVMLTGNGQANLITANGGNDTLVAGTGAATLVGGAGSDTFVINSASDVVTAKTGGVNTVQTSLSYTAGDNIANITGAGTADLSLTGNGLSNVITANSGNDTLVAGSGLATLIGGSGNDTFVINCSADVVSAQAGGVNTVLTSASYAAGANVANITATGTEAVTLTGNGQSNVITANSGDDTLIAGSGVATLVGGAGNDTFVINSAADVVNANVSGVNTVQTSVSYTAGANVSRVTGLGTADVVLTGNGSPNVLTANNGDDTLVAGNGIATLVGGSGNDTFVINSVSDVINAQAGGTNTVQTSVSYQAGANVQDVVGTGTAALVLTGNSLADVIIANSGNDTLRAGSGLATLIGGAGNDTFIVNRLNDVVQDSYASSTNTVQSSVSYVLPTNVNRLILTGSGDLRGTGNAGADILFANSGNDTLTAGSGVATLVGGSGNDTFVINNTSDIVSDSSTTSSNTIKSSVSYVLPTNVQSLILTGSANLTATGNSGTNLLVANTGADTLVGGSGVTALEGGSGLDRLIDTAGQGAFLGGSGSDTMTGGSQRSFFAAGKVSDVVTVGATSNVVALNLGSGQLTLGATVGASNILSLGGGIDTESLRLSKVNSSLVLSDGNGDSIVLAGWYSSASNQTVTQLQVIEKASASYSATSSDSLRNQAIEEFNFTSLVAQFNAAGSPTLWSVTTAMRSAQQSSSPTAAYGGDLAYYYGLNGSVSGMDLSAVQATLTNSAFAASAQTIDPWSNISTGASPLAIVSPSEATAAAASVSVGSPTGSQTASPESLSYADLAVGPEPGLLRGNLANRFAWGTMHAAHDDSIRAQVGGSMSDLFGSGHAQFGGESPHIVVSSNSALGRRILPVAPSVDKVLTV